MSETTALLQLPALDGRVPLGFLAALGVLRLVSENGYPDAALSWSRQDCTARLHRGPATVEETVEVLRGVAERIPTNGVVTGVPEDFPPLKGAAARMRMSPSELRALREGYGDNSEVERWTASLVTDLSRDASGNCDITQFAAPSGQQSMRSMLVSQVTWLRKRPEVIEEALTSWVRLSGVTGEYLDNQVLFDAADAPDGASSERGVPGATWLALMSYPLLRTTGGGGEPASSGWRRWRNGRRRVVRFVYPLWSEPLRPASVVALLEHPVFDDVDAEPATHRAAGRPSPEAEQLSVFWVGGAERQRLEGRTFAGVLTPVPVTMRPDKDARQSRGRDGARRASSGPAAMIL